MTWEILDFFCCRMVNKASHREVFYGLPRLYVIGLKQFRNLATAHGRGIKANEPLYLIVGFRCCAQGRPHRVWHGRQGRGL
ncbi:hypothetical protein CCP4SC76_3080001 [Gammaproteobacteria bacterium]